MKSLLRFNNVYCCCRLFLITYGIYMISLHCLLQGVYGVGLVVTSLYKNKNEFVNYTAITSNLCLIPTGMFLFWVNLYEHRKGAVAAIVITFIVAVFNIATAILYLSAYINFRAISFLDRLLLLGPGDMWVLSDSLPFTMWHVLAVVLILTSSFWLYYTWMIVKLLPTKRGAKYVASLLGGDQEMQPTRAPHSLRGEANPADEVPEDSILQLGEPKSQS